MPAMIQANNLRKEYPSDTAPVVALDDVSLLIPPLQFTAVMGPSGCGKSTLLNLIAGLDLPTSGRLTVNGQNPAELPESRLTDYRRSAVGVIFQFYNLLPTLSVLENVALPALLARIPEREALSSARELARQVGLEARLGHRPHQLSGGEMQRAAIARALVNRPPVVLADEPTGNLDSHAAAGVLDILRALSVESGATVVMVTHSPEAAAIADRVVHMMDGRVDTENAAVPAG